MLVEKNAIPEVLYKSSLNIMTTVFLTIRHSGMLVQQTSVSNTSYLNLVDEKEKLILNLLGRWGRSRLLSSKILIVIIKPDHEE